MITTTSSTPQRAPLWRRILHALWRGIKWCGRHWRITLSVIFGLFIAYFVIGLYRQCTDPTATPILRLGNNERTLVTAEQVSAIREIGQWEFLTIQTEELVEKNERKLFADKQLVRLYRATLRLGIDMHHAPEDWFTPSGTTAHLRLPDVGLLDEDFLDEAQAETFHEKGTWSPAVHQELADKATRAMKQRALTEENLNEAREAAKDNFTKIFTGFGFETVDITFLPPSAS